MSAAGAHVAVVGSGITGLSAAWLLHKSGRKVTLFEQNETCGGHTLTDDSPGFPVDLGFQVYNLTTYPNLIGLFEALGVETEPSEMSFAFSDQGSGLEWASHGLGTVFAHWRRCFSPSFLLMLYDVVRFGRQAPKVLQPAHAANYSTMSVGQYLAQHCYSRAFVDNYFLPMCAAVWSVPNSQVMGFPVVMLVRFWENHHLLDLVQRPVWRVVAHRSRQYVRKIVQDLPDVRMSTSVARVVPANGAAHPSKVLLETADGEAVSFDAVVLATHSDTALKLLAGQAPQGVANVLAAIPFRENKVFVHTDAHLMPRDRRLWASWNFIRPCHARDDAAVCVSYWANRLQRLPTTAPNTFVTLNPEKPPGASTVFRRLTLSHPVFSAESYAAQQALPSVQGRGSVYYAGAWCGYGFHEDGLVAAIQVAKALGAAIPWTPRAASPKISLIDSLFMRVFDGFARRAIQQGRLRIILPNGEELAYGGAKGSGPSATMRLFSCAFFRKVVCRHDTGMGESYMDGDYEVDDIGALLAVGTVNAPQIQASRGGLGVLNYLGDKLLLLAHLARSNTLGRSVSNIEAHYDIGNDVYRLFLDPSMTYSCGIHLPGDDLQQAQARKLDALVHAAGITASDHVLEIGCGWGSLAIHAVQSTGCKWTGITISKAQLEEATRRVAAAGLADRVQLLFCDYRECGGAFDAVVSCEMVEAVGQEHLQGYFQAVGRLLKPGGRAVIQAIAEPDERYEAYCRSSDFIREHVFPGGHLPCMGAMVEAARGTGLLVTSVVDIGPHYASTLRAWRAAWERNKAEILALRQTERFWRKFRFYFAYCEAAFDARYIHDFQVTWRKAADGEATASEAAPSSAAAALQAVQHPSDPVTQVLLCVYSFLAGVAVTKRRLWLMPLASAAFGLMALAVSLGAKQLLPSYRGMPAASRAHWCTSAVHLVYSACALMGAVWLLSFQPQHLTVAWRGPEGGLADALVCISAGFFAFQLWTLVHQRAGTRSAWGVTDYTLRLCLFSSAAYKGVHTPLLAATLVSELPSALSMLALLQELKGIKGRSQGLAWAKQAAFLFCQVLPHALVTASAIGQRHNFAALTHYMVATVSGIYITMRDIAILCRTAWGPIKAHAA